MRKIPVNAIPTPVQDPLTKIVSLKYTYILFTQE